MLKLGSDIVVSMSELKVVIYKITNDLNDKIYIGQTVNLVTRWQEHCKKRSKCIKIKNAIQKYGKEHFSIEILCITHSKYYANILEKFYIKIFDTVNNGYNILEGGNSSLGRIVSNETKIKMSINSKGQRRSPNTEFKKGHNTWNKGKKMSQEFRTKISEAKLNKPLSQDHRNKIGAALRKQWSMDEISEIVSLKNNGFSLRKIAEKFNVVHSTIIKLLKNFNK